MTIMISAGVGILCAIIVHIIASRAGLGPMRAYVFSFILGGLASIAMIAYLAPADWLWSMVIVLELYIPWWFVFQNLAQALESSLRVRILNELRTTDASISLQDLLLRYNDTELMNLRLARLIESGKIIERDAHLHVASAPLRGLARLFRFLKIMLLGQRSEFE